MSTHYIGDIIRLEETFRTPANQLVNPTTVSLSITSAGSTTSYVYGIDAALTRPTRGTYLLNYTAAVLGQISYIWVTTGTVDTIRTGEFTVYAARNPAIAPWSPAGDHIVFDGLETITLTTLAGVTSTIYRVLRLPANLDTGGAGALTAYGTSTQWNIWIQECPVPPQVNSLITDAYGRHYRIDSVTQSVVQNMWEISSTADAGADLVMPG